MKKIVFSLVLVLMSLNLYADIAFQNGWDRPVLDAGNISNEDDLTRFLESPLCPSVRGFIEDRDLSAVVARGLHGNSYDPVPHYTVRLFDCKTSALKYEGYVLMCKGKRKHTVHVRKDNTCTVDP